MPLKRPNEIEQNGSAKKKSASESRRNTTTANKNSKNNVYDADVSPAAAAVAAQGVPQAALAIPDVANMFLDILPLLDLGVVTLVKLKQVSKRCQEVCTIAITAKCQSPPKTFQSSVELIGAIKNYCHNDPLDVEKLAKVYGYPIGKWDVSQVTDFSYAFHSSHHHPNLSRFNENISNWDTSNATSMVYMFSNNSVFNQKLSSWNTSKVTNMSGMFCNATAFNQDISEWNTSSVRSMTYMFCGATTFDQDISWWDTSKVSGMRGMFEGATAFNHCLSTWNLSSLRSMLGMFDGATNFQPSKAWLKAIDTWEQQQEEMVEDESDESDFI